MSFFNDCFADVSIDALTDIECHVVFGKRLSIVTNFILSSANDNEINLKIKKKNIKIVGKNLKIRIIAKGELVVDGDIYGVSYAQQ